MTGSGARASARRRTPLDTFFVGGEEVVDEAEVTDNGFDAGGHQQLGHGRKRNFWSHPERSPPERRTFLKSGKKLQQDTMFGWTNNFFIPPLCKGIGAFVCIHDIHDVYDVYVYLSRGRLVFLGPDYFYRPRKFC